MDAKPLRCGNCQQVFTGKDSMGKFTSQYPYILNCKHTVCANCLRPRLTKMGISNKRAVTCAKCSAVTQFPLGNKKYEEIFMTDIFALGLSCYATRPAKSFKDIEAAVYPAGYTMTHNNTQGFIFKSNSPRKQVEKPHPNTKGLCEFCLGCASNHCEICKAYSCGPCFRKTHESGERKGHKSVSITPLSFQSELEDICPKHPTNIVKLYCEDEKQFICDNCAATNCNDEGHNLISMNDMNTSLIDDLKQALKKAKNDQSMLLKSESVIKESYEKYKLNVSQQESQIREMFHELHSILVVREQEMLKELKNAILNPHEELDELKEDINDKKVKISCLINDAQNLIKNHRLAINGAKLISELNKTVTVYEPIVDGTPDKIEVIGWDSSIKKILSEIGDIQCSINPKFAEVEVEKPTGTIEPESIVLSNKENAQSEAILRGKILARYTDLRKERTIRDIREISDVEVQHIANPHLFYIHRVQDKMPFIKLTAKIQSWCENPDSQNAIPTSVIQGQKILAKYSFDNHFYRAEVLELIKNGETKINEVIDDDNDGLNDEHKDENGLTIDGQNGVDKLSSPDIDNNTRRADSVKPRDTENIFVRVLYYDFGNSEIVPLKSLRTIKERFLKLRPQAVKCSLWDIDPKNDDGVWDPEATIAFHKYVNKRVFVMKVMEKVGDKLEVDLLQPKSSKEGPVSIREALIFLDLACFPINQPLKSFEELTKLRSNAYNYIPGDVLKVDSLIPVKVSFAESPNRFFIQVVGNINKLEKLQNEMKTFFDSNFEDMEQNFNVPFVNHPYAALLNDGEYHRVLVKEIRGSRVVYVKDVDFGEEFEIIYDKLRKIPLEFLTLPMQAYKCCLADVTPLEHGEWSDEAIEYFTNIIETTQLFQMKFHRVVTDDGYVVSLYIDSKPDFFQCLNAVMVDKGFAISVGPNSAVTEVVKPPKSAEKNIVKSLERSEDENQEFNFNDNDSLQTEVENADSEYIKVRVSMVKDPSLFYVQHEEDFEKIQSLAEELAKECAKICPDKSAKFEIGNICAVYEENLDTWYRGVVKDVAFDGRYVIFCYDFGYSIQKPYSAMRKLRDRFYAIQDYATRCHLYGYAPAGGVTSWGQLSADILKGQVEEKILHLKDHPKPKDSMSLPVTLYDKRTMIDGALEPERIEMFDINEYLREYGVAVPSKNFWLKDYEHDAIPILFEPEKPVLKIDLTRPQERETWKPALLPTWKSQHVFPCYVGYDGLIYLQTKDEMVDKVRAMSASFEAAYKNRRLPMLPLKEGQICTALFSLDNKWYRAKVSKVRETNIDVLFVDYGNTETVNVDDVRIFVGFLDVPIQCIACELYGVKPLLPNGNWSTDALNFMHASIVDKDCVAYFEEPVVKGVYPKVSLTLPGGVTLADLVVKNNFAKMIESPDDFIEFVPVSKKPQPFPQLTLPPLNTKFPVMVSTVTSHNVICIQKLRKDNPSTVEEMKANQECKKFLDMLDMVKDEAPASPFVKEPKIGENYLGKFSMDQNWYRCTVITISNGEAEVIYFDYGNSEMLKLYGKNFRELPPKLYNYPKYGIFCKLHGVSMKNKLYEEQVTNALMNSLALQPEEGAKFLCEIKLESYPYPEVELYVEQNDKLSLAYQELIDCELIVKK